MTHIIHPLDLGTLDVDRSGLTLRSGTGHRVPVPCLGWLILGGAEPVLVDTGPSDDVDWGTRHHNPLTKGEHQSLAAQLSRFGCATGDIRTVILTHLHWDHCYGNHHLPHARFIVQDRELAYASDPLPCDRPIYETDIERPPFLAGEERFVLVDGDARVADGISTVLMPGHSPGLQGVLVETASGPWLIGSDHFPLFDNIEKNVPTGIIGDVAAWYAASARARALTPQILPGHDMRVLQRQTYS